VPPSAIRQGTAVWGMWPPLGCTHPHLVAPLPCAHLPLQQGFGHDGLSLRDPMGSWPSTGDALVVRHAPRMARPLCPMYYCTPRTARSHQGMSRLKTGDGLARKGPTPCVCCVKTDDMAGQPGLPGYFLSLDSFFRHAPARHCLHRAAHGTRWQAVIALLKAIPCGWTAAGRCRRATRPQCWQGASPHAMTSPEAGACPAWPPGICLPPVDIV
jgi:hypothetical protein